MSTPASAAQRLDKLRSYIQIHRNSVINWAALIAGAWLIIRSLPDLL